MLLRADEVIESSITRNMRAARIAWAVLHNDPAFECVKTNAPRQEK
jgi:hypothetical protein